MLLLRDINNWTLSSDSELQLKAIDGLRSLLKFRSKLFQFIFSNVYKNLPSLINSHKNNVSKLTIIFISELFNKDHRFDELKEDHRDWYSYIIPPIVDRATILNDNIFKNVSIQAFKNLSENIFSSDVIEIFLNYLGSNIDDKNKKNVNNIIEIVFSTLDKNFTLFDECEFEHLLNWDKILDQLDTLYKKENEYLKKAIENLLFVIVNKIGEKPFLNLVEMNSCTDVYDNIAKIYFNIKGKENV